MKALSWNCRGINIALFLWSCCDLLHRKSPNLLCLLETKAMPRMGKHLDSRLRFSCSFEVPTQGFQGGLILLWHECSLQVDILSFSDQIIHCRIREGNMEWVSSFMYIQSNSDAKNRFWEAMAQ